MDTSWFAYVKYKDNTKEIVPINKISSINDEGQKIPFEPKDLNDYVYGKLYSVRTSLHSKNGKESKYYAVIGKLAKSVEAMNDMRPKWPHVENDDEEPESTTVEDQEENKPVNYYIQNNKAQVKTKENRKRHASNQEFKQFVENNILNENEKINDKNVAIDSSKKKIKYMIQTNKTYNNVEAENSTVNTSRNLKETKSLRKKIRQLEAELRKKDEALSFATNQQIDHLETFFEKKIIEVKERLEKNVEEKVTDIIENVFDKKLSNIENIMNTSSAISVQKVLDWINNLPE